MLTPTVRILSLVAVLIGVAGSAGAAPIYTETFDSAGFNGGTCILCFGEYATSEEYLETDYYTVVAQNGWLLSSSTYLAVDRASGDQGLLLNEGGGSASKLVTGLTPGVDYVLRFHEGGDNITSQDFRVTLDLSATAGIDFEIQRQWQIHGPGLTHSVFFTATSTDVQLQFAEGSFGPNGASPIIDDVSIEAIPEPGTGLLFTMGLLGLAGWRSDRPSRSQCVQRSTRADSRTLSNHA